MCPPVPKALLTFLERQFHTAHIPTSLAYLKPPCAIFFHPSLDIFRNDMEFSPKAVESGFFYGLGKVSISLVLHIRIRVQILSNRRDTFYHHKEKLCLSFRPCSHQSSKEQDHTIICQHAHHTITCVAKDRRVDSLPAHLLDYAHPMEVRLRATTSFKSGRLR